VIVGLVSCCGPKLPHLAPAQDLYVSDLFVKSRRFAELTCDRWAILSAKLGLVMPWDMIEPYDVTLTKMRAPARREWAILTQREIVDQFAGCHFVLLAGKEYEAALKGLDYEAPLGRAAIGQRLKWLKEVLDRRQPARSGTGAQQ